MIRINRACLVRGEESTNLKKNLWLRIPHCPYNRYSSLRNCIAENSHAHDWKISFLPVNAKMRSFKSYKGRSNLKTLINEDSQSLGIYKLPNMGFPSLVESKILLFDDLVTKLYDLNVGDFLHRPDNCFLSISISMFHGWNFEFSNPSIPPEKSSLEFKHLKVSMGHNDLEFSVGGNVQRISIFTNMNY